MKTIFKQSFPTLFASLLVALIVTSGLLSQLPAWRLDMTEDKLYSLSDGTKAMLSNLQQPVHLEFYFSDTVASELPHIREYAKRVEELLQEYQLASGGQLTLSVIDPEPFSESEDRAAEQGLQGVPASLGGSDVYFGLVAQAQSDGAVGQVIGFFNQERERFLEYDISQLVYSAAKEKMPVVGVISGLDVLGGFNYASGQQNSPWLAFEQLKQSYDVRKLTLDERQIAEDIDLLVVVHPTGLTANGRYSLDQYILAGGKAIVAVDPLAELAQPGPMGTHAKPSSQLPELFKAWGVEFNPELVVADADYGLRMPAGDSRVPLPHVGIMGVRGDGLNDQELLTMELEAVNLSAAGALSAADSATTTFIPLLSSSSNSALMEAKLFQGVQDHSILLKEFQADERRYTLAARVSGSAQTAFANGAPVDEPDAQEQSVQTNSEQASEPEDAPKAHLAESTGDIQLLVIADSDIFSDRLWVQVSQFFGQNVMSPWASNGDFLINAVENLTGSGDLISLRSRGQFSRSFEVVDELRRTAAEQFLAQEQQLMASLEALEAKISQLSQSEEGQIVELTPEQEVQIDEFEQQRLAVRKELRQVQHQLNKDIDALEGRLKLLNIALIPSLLILLMLWVSWRRSRQS